MSEYIAYEVLEAPNNPTENGNHIFTTPIYEQAVTGVNNARREGKLYFVKGVKRDGSKTILL